MSDWDREVWRRGVAEVRREVEDVLGRPRIEPQAETDWQTIEAVFQAIRPVLRRQWHVGDGRGGQIIWALRSAVEPLGS